MRPLIQTLSNALLMSQKVKQDSSLFSRARQTLWYISMSCVTVECPGLNRTIDHKHVGD